MQNYEEMIFQIIIDAGEGKSYAYEALDCAKDGDFKKADELLKKADKSFFKAHEFQSKLMQDDIENGYKGKLLIMMHAQDQLMTAVETKDLISAFIKIYKVKINDK
ncbi:PTS lactose/cellobiose transporter subunit IIA [Anaerococcus urinomassiliensis]|uniref:PTS lactose/cellobiose transporter subunit IIA n=1 Tax=Anaerococcus urinomassiliensis TaxID=1745712 RepID=UPI0009391D47|nr:PTS lactose/cellobiose transporter subunit IIA [Anaerococcus urinomassiliensis]